MYNILGGNSIPLQSPQYSLIPFILVLYSLDFKGSHDTEKIVNDIVVVYEEFAAFTLTIIRIFLQNFSEAEGSKFVHTWIYDILSSHIRIPAPCSHV